MHKLALDALRHRVATHPVLDNQAALINALEIELARVTRERDALSYPVALHTHPPLTVEAGGIRYALEVFSDEDGDWFEVKSATPTEPLNHIAFAETARDWACVELEARTNLAKWRAEQQRDDETSSAY